MILHLASKGFEVPVPIKNIFGAYKSLECIGESGTIGTSSVGPSFAYSVVAQTGMGLLGSQMASFGSGCLGK